MLPHGASPSVQNPGGAISPLLPILEASCTAFSRCRPQVTSCGASSGKLGYQQLSSTSLTSSDNLPALGHQGPHKKHPLGALVGQRFHRCIQGEKPRRGRNSYVGQFQR